MKENPNLTVEKLLTDRQYMSNVLVGMLDLCEHIHRTGQLYNKEKGLEIIAHAREALAASDRMFGTQSKPSILRS